MCYIVYPASYYAIDNFSQKIISGHSFFSNHLFVHIISKFVGKDNHAIFLFVDDGFHLHFQLQEFGPHTPNRILAPCLFHWQTATAFDGKGDNN